MKITKQVFSNAKWYSLTNDNHISVTISNIGATVVAINTPDRDGHIENITLGFKTPEEYANHHDYFGATIARSAGRIGGARWRDYQLDDNSSGNNIHGGQNPSISYSRWTRISSFKRSHEVGLVLKYLSPDGENGFPGNLTINAIFRLNNQNQFSITYIGHTSKQTIFNPTTHIYFNLSGNNKRTIDDELLTLASSNITETDADKIPTGNLLNVDNTPFDFQSGRQLADSLSQIENGLDTPFVVQPSKESPQLQLSDPISGRKLGVQTSANALVLFSSTGFNGDFLVNDSHKMTSQLGLAIEPQMLPDAVHHSGFGNVIISPSKPMMYQNIYYLN